MRYRNLQPEVDTKGTDLFQIKTLLILCMLLSISCNKNEMKVERGETPSHLRSSLEAMHLSLDMEIHTEFHLLSGNREEDFATALIEPYSNRFQIEYDLNHNGDCEIVVDFLDPSFFPVYSEAHISDPFLKDMSRIVCNNGVTRVYDASGNVILTTTFSMPEDMTFLTTLQGMPQKKHPLIDGNIVSNLLNGRAIDYEKLDSVGRRITDAGGLSSEMQLVGGSIYELSLPISTLKSSVGLADYPVGSEVDIIINIETSKVVGYSIFSGQNDLVESVMYEYDSLGEIKNMTTHRSEVLPDGRRGISTQQIRIHSIVLHSNSK